MIRTDSELAAAIRRTNARHREAGRPKVEELDGLWADLMRDLRAARTPEQEREAILLWESWAKAAIERGAA